MKFEFNLQESFIILKALKRYDNEMKTSKAALQKAREADIQDLGGMMLDTNTESIYIEDLIKKFNKGC